MQPPTNKNYGCFQKKTYTDVAVWIDDGGTGLGPEDMGYTYSGGIYTPESTVTTSSWRYTNQSKYGYTDCDYESLSGNGSNGGLCPGTTLVSDTVVFGAGTATRTIIKTSVHSVYRLEYEPGLYVYTYGFNGGDWEFLADVVAQYTRTIVWSDDYTWEQYLEDFDTRLWSNLPGDKWTVGYSLDVDGDICLASLVGGNYPMNALAHIPVDGWRVAGAGFHWSSNHVLASTLHPAQPTVTFATYRPKGPQCAKYSCTTDGTLTPDNMTSELLPWSPVMEYKIEPTSSDVASMVGGDDIQTQRSVYWKDGYDDGTPDYPVPS